MTETTPQTFDVHAWLTDAKLPQDSATVYKRGDVIGRLTELKRRIELEVDAAPVERTAADTQALHNLELEYEGLLQTFADSALTVYVRALTRDEIKALRTAHELAIKDLEITSAESNATFGYDLLSKAVVAVEQAGQERTPVTLTPQAVKDLEEALGAAQLTAILEARQRAQALMPEVDADFLRKRSGMGAVQG